MKNYLASVGIATCCLGISFTAPVSAQDIRDQWDIKTGTAELVVPGMQPQEVANKIKEAISQWSIPANLSFRSMPTETPARPDEPLRKQVYVQGAPAIEYQCQTAYAEITKRPPPVKNAFAFIAESTQVCLYSFQKGVKVYLVFTRAKKTESLTAGLFNGITKAIQGTDGERITGQLNENIDLIRKSIPSLLVARLEVPEMPVQEPDKVAVAALIPEKAPALPQAQQQAVIVAASGQALNTLSSPMQTKIEARKNLTAMGMTYHAQDHFITAIRRKDDVAVQLFLDGGGIDAAAKDVSGKSPANIALEVGRADIAKLITDSLTLHPATSVPLATVAAQPLQNPAAAPTNALKPTASLPPEILAKINAQLDSMNLPPEQKETMRANAIQQIQQIKALTDRIDPQTGALRSM